MLSLELPSEPKARPHTPKTQSSRLDFERPCPSPVCRAGAYCAAGGAWGTGGASVDWGSVSVAMRGPLRFGCLAKAVTCPLWNSASPTSMSAKPVVDGKSQRAHERRAATTNHRSPLGSSTSNRGGFSPAGGDSRCACSDCVDFREHARRGFGSSVRDSHNSARESGRQIHRYLPAGASISPADRYNRNA